MQIEIFSELRIIAIYVKPSLDRLEAVERTKKELIEACPGMRVLTMLNGQPIPKAGKPLFYVCKDDKVTISMAQKFANVKPGAIIPLNEEEWKAYHENFEAIPPHQDREE